MIFVATGVHEHGFNRLVQAVDELAQNKTVGEVFIQTGYSTYEPKHCQWAQSIDFLEFQGRLAEADLIISHGGAGCIADALELDKTVLVVPRLAKYDEHNNDHQLELAHVLQKSGRVLVVHEMDELPKKLEEAKTFTPAPSEGANQIATLIRNQLSELATKRGLSFGES